MGEAAQLLLNTKEALDAENDGIEIPLAEKIPEEPKINLTGKEGLLVI